MSRKQGRKIKVPAENRRVASVVSTVVSQLKFLTLSDGFSLTDQIDFGAPTDLGQPVSDSFTLNDSFGLALGLPADLSDTLSLSDSLELLEAYRANFSDSINLLTDGLAVDRELQIGLSDSLPSMADAVDSYELGHYLVTLADTADNTTDDLALGYGLAPSDQIVLTDSIATFGQFFLTIQDSISNWDEFLVIIPQGVDYAIERFDSMDQSDAISLFSAGFKTFSDSLTLSDAYAQRANGLQTFSDALTQSDALAMIEGERQTFSDSAIQPSDGTAIAGSIWDIGVTGEQLSQSDAISLNLDSSMRLVTASDSFTLLDSFDYRRGPSRWNDAISVSTASQNNLTQNLSDTLPSMADDQVNKFTRWRDAVSVQKVNAGALTLTVSDTNSSMSDAVSTSRTQIGFPISDISVGLWSATPLFNKIDEFTANDTDQIVSATNPSNDTCEVGLTTTASDPVSSVDHIVSYRYRKSANAGRQIDLTVRLMQGTTIIATFTHTAIGNTITQANQTLSGAQADSITNYGDLRIRFVANAVGTGTGRAAQVTWAQFRCPK